MPRLTLVPLPGHPQHQARSTAPSSGEGEARFVLEVAEGTTVLDAALGHGVVISTLCGGAMQCKTCRVKVADETPASAISPRGKKEHAVCVALGLDDESRLACQVKVRADAVVLLPPPVSEDARDTELPDDDDELSLGD